MNAKEIENVIKAAYYWGRDNGEKRSDKNLADFFDTSIVKNLLNKVENLAIPDVTPYIDGKCHHGIICAKKQLGYVI